MSILGEEREGTGSKDEEKTTEELEESSRPRKRLNGQIREKQEQVDDVVYEDIPFCLNFRKPVSIRQCAYGSHASTSHR